MPPRIDIAEKGCRETKNMLRNTALTLPKRRKTMLKVGVAVFFLVLNVNFRYGQDGYAELNDVELSRYKFT